MWAVFLAQYGKFKDYDQSVYNQSFALFGKAIELAPRDTHILQGWAEALVVLADNTNNAEIYKESIDKYNKMTDIGSNQINVNDGRGYAYMQLGKAEKNLSPYKSQIESSFHQAEQMQSQSAAYNLACYYSLIKENDKAIYWLNRTLNREYGSKMTVLTKERIDKDSDFDNIRKDKKYKQLLNQYFKKK